MLCEQSTVAQDALGEEIASSLRIRLSELHAAQSIEDLIAGNPRVDPLCDNRMILDLADSYRIMFCANHAVNPKDESGDVDWTSVHRIKIIKIGQAP